MSLNVRYLTNGKKALYCVINPGVSPASYEVYGSMLQMNVDKLRARYPDGFDSEHSTHRKKGDI